MATGSIAEDFAMAVPAELLWKATFNHDAIATKKVFAGLIDDVEINGGGGPGSLVTMKFNPTVGAATVLKSRLAVKDHAALVVSWDGVVVEGGEVDPAQFKSQVVQVKVVPAGDGACVAKVTVEYKLNGGGVALSPEDKSKLMKGYAGLIKKAEENIIARPVEFA